MGKIKALDRVEQVIWLIENENDASLTTYVLVGWGL
jgi:hypothetical protein